jgi:hypothetical protein
MSVNYSFDTGAMTKARVWSGLVRGIREVGRFDGGTIQNCYDGSRECIQAGCDETREFPFLCLRLTTSARVLVSVYSQVHR